MAPESCNSAAENSADYWALIVQDSPELAQVVQAWERLPETIRARILGIIEAATMQERP